MRTPVMILSFCAMLLAACADDNSQTNSASDSVTHSDSRPNILLIIGDDMGFSDVGAFSQVYKNCFGEVPSKTLPGGSDD